MKTTPFQTANECLLHTLSCFSRGLRENLLISKNKGNWRAGYVYYINRQVSVPKSYVVKFIFCFFKQGFNQNNFYMVFFSTLKISYKSINVVSAQGSFWWNLVILKVVEPGFVNSDVFLQNIWIILNLFLAFLILNESSGHRWRQLRTSTNPQVLNITHSFWANSFKRLKNKKKTQRIILYFQLEMDDKADQMITDLLTHGAFGLQRKIGDNLTPIPLWWLDT